VSFAECPEALFEVLGGSDLADGQPFNRIQSPEEATNLTQFRFDLNLPDDMGWIFPEVVGPVEQGLQKQALIRQDRLQDSPMINHPKEVSHQHQQNNLEVGD